MKELLEHLEYVFNKPPTVKYKKVDVMSFDLEYGLLLSNYIETDGTVTMHMENNTYTVKVHDYTYIILIKEVECSYDSCVIFINKSKQEEGISNIKKCLQYF